MNETNDKYVKLCDFLYTWHKTLNHWGLKWVGNMFSIYSFLPQAHSTFAVCYHMYCVHLYPFVLQSRSMWGLFSEFESETTKAKYKNNKRYIYSKKNT